MSEHSVAKPVKRVKPSAPTAKQGSTKGLTGANVYINVSDKSAEDRAARAAGRVDNLQRKIERLSARPYEGHSAQALVDAKLALAAWQKVLATANFELNYDKDAT